jgi:hypothetical protein
LCRGFPLHPDDEHDPDTFRLDLSAFGMATVGIVFGRDVAHRVTAVHVDPPGQRSTLLRRPAAKSSRTRPLAALTALAAAAAMTAGRRRRRAREEVRT